MKKVTKFLFFMYLLAILFNTSGYCGFLKSMDRAFNPTCKLRAGIFSPDGTKIACSANMPKKAGGWKSEIWIMAVDGSNPVKLLEGKRIGVGFRFLPNDSRHLLIIIDGRKVCLLNVEQKKAKEVYTDTLKLGKHDGIRGISNDCSKVILQKRTKWNFGFWNKHSYSIVNLHTSKTVELLPLNEFSIAGGFSFSPDDLSIVFDNGYNIYSIDVDGTDFRCLTKGASKVSKRVGKWGTKKPIFSPDGRLIAFQAKQSLFVMKRDGADIKKIAEIEEGKGNVFYPGKFTPDGKQIIFIRIGRVSGKSSAVCIVNIDGTGLRVIADNELPYSGFDFSPDGKTMVFEGGSIDHRVLFTSNLDGSNKRQIFPKPREH